MTVIPIRAPKAVFAMTQEGYLKAYEAELMKDPDWSSDRGSLLTVLHTAKTALESAPAFRANVEPWNPISPAAKRAWISIGGLGYVTLEKLRRLP